jgi:hypothetical protein
VNPEKTIYYVLMSVDQNPGQWHIIETENDVSRFRDLGTTLTDLNCMHEEIKSRLNMGECLLPFCSESFVFLPAVQECKS